MPALHVAIDQNDLATVEKLIARAAGARRAISIHLRGLLKEIFSSVR